MNRVKDVDTKNKVYSHNQTKCPVQPFLFWKNLSAEIPKQINRKYNHKEISDKHAAPSNRVNRPRGCQGNNNAVKQQKHSKSASFFHIAQNHNQTGKNIQHKGQNWNSVYSQLRQNKPAYYHSGYSILAQKYQQAADIESCRQQYFFLFLIDCTDKISSRAVTTAQNRRFSERIKFKIFRACSSAK